MGRGDGPIPVRRPHHRFRRHIDYNASDHHRGVEDGKYFPRGVLTMGTPPKYSSTSSAPAALYRAPQMTVINPRPCSPSSTPTTWTRCRRSSGSFSGSRASPRCEKVSACLCGHDMEGARHRMGYAIDPAATGRGH